MGSMYGIFIHIWMMFRANVITSIPYMEPMGYRPYPSLETAATAVVVVLGLPNEWPASLWASIWIRRLNYLQYGLHYANMLGECQALVCNMP